jgi:hypothetical protein
MRGGALLGSIVRINWLSNCAVVSFPRAASASGELGSGGWESRWKVRCGGGYMELERLCGRRDLGDMFQSDSSVVELIEAAVFYRQHYIKWNVCFDVALSAGWTRLLWDVLVRL